MLRSRIHFAIVILAFFCSEVTFSATLSGIRGSFFHFTNDPFHTSASKSYQYIQDGLMIIEDGKVKELDGYLTLKEKYPQVHFDNYQGHLIVPGFVDTHIHYPQVEMIGSYGEQLLEWLNKYTFPVESQFQNKNYAKKVASFFINELLRNGTTTALIFGTVHPESVDSIFEAAEIINMRVIAGKVMMDRKHFAPEYLRDTAESSYSDSKSLIQKWHGKKRLLYAVTPRFAITSTEDQLRKAGQLLTEFPDVYLQTHLSENKKEIDTVASLFPQSKGYLDVYDRFGLLGPRSIFAHAVHLRQDEFQRMAETRSSISFCPTSNLFLGSGLFKIAQATSESTPIRVGLGTDVGGGTSLSMLQTMNEAYKVAQLQNETLSAFKSFYLATLGGARALSLDDRIGNFAPGKEADFVVLNLNSTPLQTFKMVQLKAHGGRDTDTVHDMLFALEILGDDRAVKATYVNGLAVFNKE